MADAPAPSPAKSISPVKTFKQEKRPKQEVAEAKFVATPPRSDPTTPVYLPIKSKDSELGK